MKVRRPLREPHDCPTCHHPADLLRIVPSLHGVGIEQPHNAALRRLPELLVDVPEQEE